jgi:3-hydroxyisobutyrate dehydrogenase-like beta-hydroxyacid dehydrogenase
MTDTNVLGFIGLGVMGEAMCRNLATKSGARMVAYDTRSRPLDALAQDGVERRGPPSRTSRRVRGRSRLPTGRAAGARVCLGHDGLVAHVQAGQTVVDMSTVPVALARELGAAFAAKSVAFADAPVARTAQGRA